MKNKEQTVADKDRQDDLFAADWNQKDRRSSVREQPARKRGKLLPSIVFVLALILTSLLGVVYLAYKDGSPHLLKLQEAEQSQLDDYTAFLNSVPRPESWDETLFASLKQQALDAYDRTQLDTIHAAIDGDRAARETLETVETASAQPNLDAYKRLFENPGAVPAEIAAFAAGDPGFASVVLEYPDHAGQPAADVDLDVDLNTLPDLKTWNPAWGYTPYAGSLFMIKGGAPTAIAEVFSYLLKDPAITPLRVGQLAAQTGYEADPIPEGVDGSLFSEAALTYGVFMNPTPAYKTHITEAVDLKDIVIAATGDRANPRFLVIYGNDENGNWVVNDPTSAGGPQSIDPDTIKDSLIAAYAFWVQ